MAVKNTAQVIIGGKIITLGGYESEEYLQQKDQEMYDLKHELISLRMQIEEAQKNEQEALDEKNLLEGKVKELEKELDEMLK